MSKKLLIAVAALFGLHLILAAWFVLHGDILFGYNGDIARDFFLMQTTAIKKIALIGAHSGGIPGVFHGPAWIYLNLPAFVLAQGNPIGVGWFWVLLSITSVIITGYIAKKLFDTQTAVLTALLYSTYLISATKGFTNPFGAVILFPIFFYFIYQYHLSPKVRDLIIALFLVGCVIQFQIAFGGPILLLTIILVLHKLKQTKQWKQLAAFAVLAIPLSTYILFELRYKFLQTTSVINYISGKENFAKQSLLTVLQARAQEFLIDGLYIFTAVPTLIALIIVIACGYLIYTQRAKIKNIKLYKLFFFFYAGYWTLMLLYRGFVFDYYYWPFLPMVVMLFVSLARYIPRLVYITVFAVLYIATLHFGYDTTVQYAKQYIGQDDDSWTFSRQLAEQVYADAPDEFGYYVFTPDLNAIGVKYAFHYTQKHQIKQGTLNTKKPVTYVIFAPPPKDKPYDNGKWWKTDQVNIKRAPDSMAQYKDGYRVEKYLLTEDEVAIQNDPGLVNTFVLPE
ncbi:MAG: hypothetical protein ACEQSA_00800 [Weeksellaceae bacterium]